ncbi:MAG: hypothetical protein ABJ263_17295 [Tateyamaria sp.]|uniref:hypothetical protein n=1 Tax=Tateyamaria sp. TaxID=1929288 RepID=UPI00327147B1
MIRKISLAMALPLVITLGACAPASQHEVACVGGTFTGAVIGGAIGNRFGGGSGNSIMTGAGAFTGAVAASNSLNCGG